jgi:imidazolonepropionase-like amidohydrolase
MSSACQKISYMHVTMTGYMKRQHAVTPDHEQLQQEIVAQFLKAALQSGYPFKGKNYVNIKLNPECRH